MSSEPESIYTYDSMDYILTVRITNGLNDIYLKPEAWENLVIEEDIFEWHVKGSIVINTNFEAFERDSDETVGLFGDSTKTVYKFRNDGRDTLYIYLLPKSSLGIVAPFENIVFEHAIWGTELECVIYDCTDFSEQGSTTSKQKKLYFWEKTYQMMLEKSGEFTTATVGDNKGKTDIHHLSNEDRSLKTGEALGELLINDEDFSKHANLYADGDADYWNIGDDKNKVFYTSPTNYSFYDDLNYLYNRHTSDESEQFQPCILKFEKSANKGEPKQFSLKSIKKYFEKAGVDSPGEYLIEQFILEEFSVGNNGDVPIIKVPDQLNVSSDINKKLTAEDYSIVKNYKLIDFSGRDNANRLFNRFITSHNDEMGQFNIEIKEHKSEKFKDFYKDNIANQIKTKEKEDRLPMTPFITKGYNSRYIYSEFQKEESRIPDGRNKLLKYYLFSNLGISFSTRGLTFRQPGRFFSLARNTKNDREYDHKIEGQYFITNVIHHFSNKGRHYSNQIVGVKTHTFQEVTKMPEGDVMLIK